MGKQDRVVIRAATEPDVPAIAGIQSTAPEASQWNPSDYLRFDCRVAVSEDSVVGFIVSRTVATAEWEILNLAVAAPARRQGIGRLLLTRVLADCSGAVFLEVRESNTVARRFYEHLGFQVVTTRVQYYPGMDESAIVMKRHSC